MKSLCKRNCTICIFFERCGGCSLCEAAICDSKCGRCGTLCPRRGVTIKHLNEILECKDDIKSNKREALPYHIPILPDKLMKPLDYTIAPVIAVHGANVFSQNGERIRKIYRDNGFRKALNVDIRSEGILQFYVKDRTLEGFWDNRESIYKELKDQGFKLIIAPNFSVYEDTPRLEHIYNIQRSMIVYDELIKNGFNAVPDISWYNIKDLDIWIDMIIKSNCRVIAFSFQVVDVRLKASSLWKHYLAGFKYMCDRLSNLGDMQILIVGASSHRRMIEIRAAAHENIKIHVLNQSAYLQSQRGMYSHKRVSDLETPKHELLEKNIIYFNDLYEELNN